MILSCFQIFNRRQTKTKEEAKLDPEALKQLRMQGGGEQLEYVKVQDIVSKYFFKADEVKQINRFSHTFKKQIFAN
jgi:hypothetical protein